jgi:hypothetical protein
VVDLILLGICSDEAIGHSVQIGFLFQSGNDGYGSGPGWYLDNIQVTPTPTPVLAPEIVVHGPLGGTLVSGDYTLNYGTYLVGSGTSTTLTIRNTGNAGLTLNSIKIDGTNGATSPDFAVTASPASPIAALGGTTAFTFGVAPVTSGLISGTLQINSNDPVIPSYDITLEVTGKPRPIYIVTPVSGSNGAISPSTPQTVTSGSSITFTATPDSGYSVNQWIVNGGTRQMGGTEYTLSPVTGNSNVLVAFKASPTYTVNPVAGPNGTISPSTVQTVNSGASILFAATPYSGYSVNEWLVNGSSVQTGGTNYTLSDITGHDNVLVVFKVTP